MFSPTNKPYYLVWRVAIRCWVKSPMRRPSMTEVVQCLQPNDPPASEQVPVPSAPGRDIDADVSPISTTVSERTTSDDDSETEANEVNFCYCRGGGMWTLVVCSNEECHLKQVGVRRSKVFVSVAQIYASSFTFVAWAWRAHRTPHGTVSSARRRGCQAKKDRPLGLPLTQGALYLELRAKRSRRSG